MRVCACKYICGYERRLRVRSPLLPAPPWCRAESTEPGCRPAAGGAVPCADTHSQRRGCTPPPCVQTGCRRGGVIAGHDRAVHWLRSASTTGQCPFFKLNIVQDGEWNPSRQSNLM